MDLTSTIVSFADVINLVQLILLVLINHKLGKK